jgi:hypothetical protein
LKESIGISKLILDGEEIEFSGAEYIVFHTKVNYGDYHDYKKYGIIHGRRIEVVNPDINVELNKSNMDIEAYCVDGIKRGCRGIVDELETDKDNKTIQFGIQVIGKVNEKSLT